MENRLEEIRKRAEKILRNYSLDVLTDEKELMETLTDISKINEYNELLNKTLDYIERYLNAKQKMILKEEDSEFLKELAEDLKYQNTRRTDGVIYNPLFKLISKDEKEKYFLARKRAEKHLEKNKEQYKNDIIVLQDNDYTDLTKLLEIIVRNF